VFIAVGTPSRRGDGHADLSYVYAAAEEVAQALTGFTVIVNKSTVPVGTGDEVERIIRATNPKADFAVVSNPEFLREGAAIDDFKRPDRIVIGGDDPRAMEVMRQVYRPLYLNKSPIAEMSRRAASASTIASAQNSCMQAPAMAAAVSPRIRWPSSRPARIMTRPSGSSRPSSPSTTSASAPWAAR
jgi:UDPglucose 6-dehydrogenase